MTLRPGVRLGLDWGDARIGVAACDAGGVLAYPVTTVAAVAAGGGTEAGVDAAIASIRALVTEYEPLEVLFGLPRSLSGGEGPAATRLRALAGRLALALAPIPVRLVDERLSTVSASRAMRRAGVNAKQQRSRIDMAAAVTIVEQALDGERNTGRAPGELVSTQSAPPA